MNNRQAKKWEKVRRRGATLYALTVGLVWGLLTALIIPVVMMLLEDGFTMSVWLKELTTSEGILRSLVFLLFGPFFGWAMWAINEKRYKRYREENA